MDILGLKREYLKSFDTFSDAYIERELNLVPLLNFSVPKEMGKYFKEEYYIQVEGEGEYILKEKKKSGDRYDIICKPNLDDLQKDYYPNYTYTTATLKAILSPLLNPLGWEIKCDDSRKETLTGKNKTLLEIIQHGMELFQYEYVWDILNKAIIAAPKIGEDKGSYLHQELNLRDLNVTTHSYDYVTRLIVKGKDDLGIESINNGIPYLEPTVKYTNKIIYGTWQDQRYTVVKNLKEAGQKLIDSLGAIYKSYEVDIIDLAKLSNKYKYLDYQIGDTLTLVDKENETFSKERIISKKEYLREKIKNSVVLSNAPLSINQIREIQESNLENEIKVTRQYITVLQGEIKSKVSEETYKELQDRVSIAEEKITPEAITETVTKTVESKLSDPETVEKFKGKDGENGVGIETTNITYAKSRNGQLPPYSGWSTQVPEANPEEFIWTKTEWIYTDGTKKTGYSIGQIGKNGKDGENATIYSEEPPSDNSKLWHDKKENRVKYFNQEVNDWVNLDSEVAENLENIKVDITAQIENKGTEILQTVSESFYDTSKVDELIQQQETKLSQESDNFSIAIEALQKVVDENKNLTDDELKFIKTYFEFNRDGLVIGKNTSNLKVEITNERMSFIDDGQEVAYLSNNKLYVYDAHIINSLRLGNFEFVPRESGNLSFRKVRN
ncbi:phage tail spike protein [Helcococcus kunzii]|uniref:phage tail spike protein n=1 Tax=Helcococcus kunzii TaxID=40091 RepID=UPI0038AA4E27